MNDPTTPLMWFDGSSIVEIDEARLQGWRGLARMLDGAVEEATTLARSDGMDPEAEPDSDDDESEAEEEEDEDES